MLCGFVLAALFLMVLQWHVAGMLAWAAGFWLAWGDEERAVRRRMGMLFGCVGLLVVCSGAERCTVRPNMANGPAVLEPS